MVNANPVNCWKPKGGDTYGNQQPSLDTSSVLEGSETKEVEAPLYTPSGVEAQGILLDDDIVRSSGKLEAACYLYKIINSVNNKIYIGITNNLDSRWRSHKFTSLSNSRPLYCAIRKYGIENFTMVPLVVGTREYILELEIRMIASLNNLYNVTAGGEGGYAVTDRDSWIEKLKKARKGRKPALGMKHSEENKRFFAECGRKKGKIYNEDVIKLSFKEAKELYGISKTHYYRLKADTE